MPLYTDISRPLFTKIIVSIINLVYDRSLRTAQKYRLLATLQWYAVKLPQAVSYLE